MTGAKPAAGVDVVVVTADTRDLVLDCLDHVEPAADVTMTVVDNGSRDGTARAVGERFPAACVVRLQPPAGFAAACNRGAERGSSALVLFLNSDVFAEQRGVERLVRALAAQPAAVAAGGCLVDPSDGSTQALYRPRAFPTLGSLAAQLIGVERVWSRNPLSRRYLGTDLDAEAVTIVDQPAAACLMVRRSALERVGGFDEGYWFWYEDVDLLRRLSALGHALYVPNAVFRHIGGASFARWEPADRVVARVFGLARYARAHLGPSPRRALGALIVLVAVPRVFGYALPRPALSRAWRWAARSGAALAAGRAAPERP